MPTVSDIKNVATSPALFILAAFCPAAAGYFSVVNRSPTPYSIQQK